MNARGLHRADDPATSRIAASRVDAVGLEALVVSMLESAGEDGMTSHEIAAHLGRELVSISPRMKPLLVKGSVRKVGRRDGRTVWGAA